MMKIIAHGDADGICSAALVLMVPLFKKLNPEIFFSHPTGLSHDLANVNEDLIILDIAQDRKHWSYAQAELERISKKNNVIFIDHHEIIGEMPKDVEFYNKEGISATELTYKFFRDDMPESADLTACIGAICDYMIDSPLMKDLMIRFEKRALFLDAGLLAQSLYPLSRDYQAKREITVNLSNFLAPVEMELITKNAIEYSIIEKHERGKIIKSYDRLKNIAFIRNPKASRSKAAHWIMGDSGLTVGLVITDHFTKKDKVDFVIRGRDLIDLRKVVPSIAEKYGGTAGGHSNACGARIPKIHLDAFLEDFDNAISLILKTNNLNNTNGKK